MHHIQRFAQGGADTPENLVCLCRLCHKQAPHLPEQFLEYQKIGGKCWSRVLANLIEQEPELSQDLPAFTNKVRQLYHSFVIESEHG